MNWKTNSENLLSKTIYLIGSIGILENYSINSELVSKIINLIGEVGELENCFGFNIIGEIILFSWRRSEQHSTRSYCGSD